MARRNTFFAGKSKEVLPQGSAKKSIALGLPTKGGLLASDPGARQLATKFRGRTGRKRVA